MKTVHAMQTEQLAQNGALPARHLGRSTCTGLGWSWARVPARSSSSSSTQPWHEAQRSTPRSSGRLEYRGRSQYDGQGDLRSPMRIRTALRHADVAADQVGHIHAHGISTFRSDIDESRAIHQVFGDREEERPGRRGQELLRQPLAPAAASVELIASTLALRHGRLFPVLQLRNARSRFPPAAVTSANVSPGDCFVTVNTTPQGQAAAVGRPSRTWKSEHRPPGRSSRAGHIRPPPRRNPRHAIAAALTSSCLPDMFTGL